MIARRLAGAVDKLNDTIGGALRYLAFAMVVLGAWNALARWATRALGVQLGSNALNELQWYLFSLIFLLGAAYGLRHDVHVRVDVLHQRMSARTRAWVDVLGLALFVIPFSLLMIRVSWPVVAASWAVRETSPDPGGLPRWPIKAVVPVAFALLSLQGLALIVRRIAVLRGEHD